ncbi:unnamed protein product [Mytilus coruscus]|uniref:Uncharacterized protein n=1 Tax=Mytilus coruscus TaxID=42192 RepID=A0A6J8AM32_MYTCO|nr:unnamed protein product [Mytilus coruscus]
MDIIREFLPEIEQAEICYETHANELELTSCRECYPFDQDDVEGDEKDEVSLNQEGSLDIMKKMLIKQKKIQTGRGLYGRFKGSYLIPVNPNSVEAESKSIQIKQVTPVEADANRAESELKDDNGMNKPHVKLLKRIKGRKRIKGGRKKKRVNEKTSKKRTSPKSKKKNGTK